MSTSIRIIVEDAVLMAQLFDTPCAQGILNLLPLETIPNVWGDECYFEIPLEHGLDHTATSDVEIGDIGVLAAGSGARPVLRPHTDERRIKACAGK